MCLCVCVTEFVHIPRFFHASALLYSNLIVSTAANKTETFSFHTETADSFFAFV